MVMLTRLIEIARNPRPASRPAPAEPPPWIPEDWIPEDWIPEDWIPEDLQDWVLGRDSHCCRAPGCGGSQDLAVCVVDSDRPGGNLDPDNLITMCSVCRPIWQLMGSGEFHVENARRPGRKESPVRTC
jgi:hypothetical protein